MPRQEAKRGMAPCRRIQTGFRLAASFLDMIIFPRRTLAIPVARALRHGLLVLGLMISLASHVAGDSAGSDDITPAERLWLKENQPRITLAFETNYAPFSFLDANDRPSGLAHDYMRLLEAKLGIHFNQRRFS